MLDSLLEQLRRLDLRDGNIKPTVENIRIIQSVKNKLLGIILSDDYIKDVKEYLKSFGDITKLQNEYWKSVEADFSPPAILKEIKQQTIEDTVSKLTEAGIGTNIADQITDILRQNITGGGSYKSLETQLRALVTGKNGILLRYTKQITTDAVNQYSAQYTQVVSSDLGYEWFWYQGTDIETTRPFCDAMTDMKYFHISEIPRLIRAEDLYYTNNKTGKKELVPIYEKTGLPSGMIPGTNASNIMVRRGGYNCGHQIRPVSEKLVPQYAKDRILK